MKKISDYLLLWVLVMITLPFIFVSEVKADGTDYFYSINNYQWLNTLPIYNSYHDYTGFNDAYHYFSGSTPFGGGYNFHADSLLNISNKFHIEFSFTANFRTEFTLVPYQDNNYLNSCLYLTQNSYNPRSYLANCFSFWTDTNMNITNLKSSVVASESLSLDTSNDGVVSVGINDYGSQYTFNVSFDATISEVNRDYFFTVQVSTPSGWFYFDNNTYITSIWTSPKISVVPYFTADNSLFSKFFNQLNFNMHGLTSVISAPIGFFNSFRNPNVNQNWNFVVFNKTIEMPNGLKLFWNRQDVYSFRLSWNILFGGWLIYLVYKRLFKYIKNLFNPENDEVVNL